MENRSPDSSPFFDLAASVRRHQPVGADVGRLASAVRGPRRSGGHT